MDKQVIIIIGLPGSGKTTFGQSLENTHKLYDDFITHFYNGKVIDDLKEGVRVCLTDPRLCDYNVFVRFMNQIEKCVDRAHIHLVLFENDPERCLENVQIRNTNMNGICETIKKLSCVYDIDKYKDYICQRRTAFLAKVLQP